MKKVLLLVLFITTSFFAFSQTARDSYSVAQGLFVQRKYYEAVDNYKEAIELNPYYREALLGLSEAFFYLGEYDEALKYVLQARNFYNNNTELLNLMGRIYIGKRDLDSAEELFSNILLMEPNNVDARFGQAEINIIKGQFSAARELYGEALNLSPGSLRGLLSMSLLLDGQERYQEAEEYIELAITFGSDSPDVHYFTAYHYMKTGLYDKAELHIELCRRLDPDYMDIDNLHGRILLQKGEYEASITYFQEALRNNRSDSVSWYLCGLAYWYNDDIGSAIVCFKRSSQQEADDEIARIVEENIVMREFELGDSIRSDLALFHLEQGNEYRDGYFYEKALREFRRALQLDPFSMDARFDYSQILFRTGLFYRSLKELQILVSLGTLDQDVVDQIELQTRLLANTLAGEWDVDLETEKTEIFKISLYYKANSLDNHLGAEPFLTNFFMDNLLGNSSIEITDRPRSIETFSDAFQLSRESKDDYFAIIEWDETERGFSCSTSLYLAATGDLISQIKKIRTGNGRVTASIVDSVAEINKILPYFGTLVDRKNNRVLINLGTEAGIEEDQELFVLNSRPTIIAESPGVIFQSEDILATINIERVDESYSVGVLDYRGLFDLVNIGDYVIFKPDEYEDVESLPSLSPDFYQWLLKL